MAFLLQSAYGTKNFQSHSYDQSSLDSLNGVPLESSTDTFKSKMVGIKAKWSAKWSAIFQSKIIIYQGQFSIISAFSIGKNTRTN